MLILLPVLSYTSLHRTLLYRTYSLGLVPEPFIRILSTINRAQFESINEKYKGNNLIKDITSKLGGDFENAVLTMCADRYEYFAGKVEKCLKGYSADKDGLCRWDYTHSEVDQFAYTLL
jgi:Annexin